MTNQDLHDILNPILTKGCDSLFEKYDHLDGYGGQEPLKELSYLDIGRGGNDGLFISLHNVEIGSADEEEYFEYLRGFALHILTENSRHILIFGEAWLPTFKEVLKALKIPFVGFDYYQCFIEDEYNLCLFRLLNEDEEI